jgi:hypothetical protein
MILSYAARSYCLPCVWDCMLRFLHLQVNGVDVRDLQTASVRSSVAVVPQDTVLFNDTILQNIRCAILLWPCYVKHIYIVNVQSSLSCLCIDTVVIWGRPYHLRWCLNSHVTLCFNSHYGHIAALPHFSCHPVMYTSTCRYGKPNATHGEVTLHFAWLIHTKQCRHACCHVCSSLLFHMSTLSYDMGTGITYHNSLC